MALELIINFEKLTEKNVFPKLVLAELWQRQEGYIIFDRKAALNMVL
jgi:hypothetical protein